VKASHEHQEALSLFDRVQNIVTQVYHEETEKNPNPFVLQGPSGRNSRKKFTSPAPDLATIDYGCFCRDLGRITPDKNIPINWSSHIGHPVNKIDGLCKLLLDGWACLKASGVDLSIPYTSPGRSATNTEDAISECDRLNHDKDAANLCKVEENFSTSLVQLLFSGETLGENPITNESDRFLICHPGAVNRNIHYSDVLCCDKLDYPDKCIVYGPRDRCDPLAINEG